MKTLTTLLALALFCATGYGQTIKSLGFNTTNGEVVYTGTNTLTFTNAFTVATNAVAQVRTNLGLGSAALAPATDFARAPIVKWKSAAQSVTNSTTLIDDDTLFFATETNARYYVRLYMMTEGAAGAIGTHSFVVTTTNATVYGTWRATGGTFGTTPLTTETSFNLGAPNARAFYVNFTVEGGASPGEVKLQWAQGTASTNASSVSEGSALIAEKLP
jgi:hypothetical protein